MPYAVAEVCGYLLPVAEIEDLLFLTDEQGLDFLATVENHVGESAFVAAVQELEASFPDEFAGAAYIQDGGSWVAFRDDLPRRAVELLGSQEVELIAGRGFSEAELNEALISAFTEISALPGVEEASGSYDQETGRITIDVYSRNPDLVLSAEASWRSANPRVTLDVNLRDTPSGGGPNHHLKGGAQWEGGGSLCTWGFGVQHITSGLKGLSTAHHCATRDEPGLPIINSATYKDHNGAGLTNLSFINRAAGSHGDIAWYAHSTHPATHIFYYNTNQTRAVVWTSTAVVGQTLYAYGMTSKRVSSKVYARNICVKYFGYHYPEYCGLTAMERAVTTGGDSGGPWYSGQTAYGLTSGTWWLVPHFRAVFTPVVPHLQNGMGVRVMVEQN